MLGSAELGELLVVGEAAGVEVAELVDAGEHVGGLEPSACRRRPRRPAASTSSHEIGVDTPGAGVARNEYAHTVVLWRSFWLQSTNTLPGRWSRAMFTVTRFLSRDSRMRPTASANALVASASADGRSPTERWMPFEPDVLATTCSPSWSSRSRTSSGDACAVDDVRRRAGVEVEHHRGGAPRVAGPGLGRVELERGQVGRPHEPGQVVDRARLDVGVGVERDGREPGGAVAGAALLEEPLALDAVGEAHHRDRAVLEVGEHRRRDPGVVVDHLAFGEAGRGVQDLVEVGEPELGGRPPRRGSRSPERPVPLDRAATTCEGSSP